jgi:hypothetical protein
VFQSWWLDFLQAYISGGTVLPSIFDLLEGEDEVDQSLLFAGCR